MTRPRGRAAGADPIPPDSDVDGMDSDIESIDLDYLSIELNEPAVTVTLQRVNDREPTQWDYLDKIPAADFQMETIKQQYGGGKYRALIYGANGKSLKKVAFRIDPRFKPAAAGTIVGQHPAPSDLAELKVVVQGLADIVRGVAANMQTPAGRDPFELALKIMEVTHKASPAPPVAPAATLPDLFNLLQKGIEIGRQSAGEGGGDGDSFGSALKSLEPLIGAVAENLKSGGARRERPALASGPPDPAVSATPAPVAMPVPAGPPWAAAVRPHLSQLIGLAHAGTRPESWSQPILDMLPDDVFGELEAMAKRDDFADVVMAALPELSSVDKWARALLASMREDLIPEEATPAGGAADDDSPAN